MAKEQVEIGMKDLIEATELKRLGDLIAEIDRSRIKAAESEIDIKVNLGSEIVIGN